MSTTPVSMRLDADLVAALDAMADHRELDRTKMIARTLDVALKARQRTCSETHRHGKRCGVCGVLTEPPTGFDNL